MQSDEANYGTLAAQSGTGPTGGSITPPSSGVSERVGDRYEILALIGCGGMGCVYRARDTELDEIVALKMLRRELVDAPGMLDRFRREVKLARKVTHRNVARVFDIGEHGSEKFLTMEFVEGEPLTALLAREGALPVARTVEIATAVCAGLSAAHAAGIVHRDLKPDNVLLARDGRVVITDFGIARAEVDRSDQTRSLGIAVGTPAYMAPEQVEGFEDIDGRTDIYALGAMLYELFTATRPFRGETPMAVAVARLTQPPPDPRDKRPDLPTPCVQVVLRCLARKREERYPTADKVAEELALLTLPATPLRMSIPVTVREGHGGTESQPPAGEKTVAVLPFRNSGAPDDDYIADGLTDDLIDMLSMTRGLKVRSRGVVMRYKGIDQDPREIGRELGVQVVVEGSVRRLPGKVRISARLVSVADGFQLWAKRFDRPEQDVLLINDEAAGAIAEALTVDLGPKTREAPANAEAVDLYLRARHEYRKFWPEHLREAIQLYEQALARAPNDPTILSGYAMARARLLFFYTEGADIAKEAAERAVTAAPNLGEPHMALASVLFQMLDTVGAVRELKLAVARNPSLAEAHAMLGTILVEIGRFDEARVRIRLAVSIDPETPLAHRNLARIHAFCGEWDKVDPAMQLAVATEGLTSLWAFRARFAAWTRDKELGRQYLSQMADLGDIAFPKRLILLLLDEDPAMVTEFERLASMADGGQRRRIFFNQLAAEVSALVHLVDRSIESTHRAVDLGLIDLAWLDICPLLDDVRKHPSFPTLRARVDARAAAILAAYGAL